MSTFASVIVIICLCITLTSIKEKPLVINEDDESECNESELEYETSHLVSNNRQLNSYDSIVQAKNSIDEQNLQHKIQRFNDLLDENEECEDHPITIGLLYKSVLNVWNIF